MQQHMLYGAACGLMGARATAFAWRAPDGAVAGWALILLRHWPGLGPVAMLARGPVWAPGVAGTQRAAALSGLLATLRGRMRVVMATPDRIDGRDTLAGRGWLSLMGGGTLARMPLCDDAARLRAGLHGKWRNRLARAEQAGLEVRLGPLPEDARHWLLQAEDAQVRARRYKRLPHAFALAWRRAGGPGATLLATAHAGGEPVAGMLFLRHGGAASYHIGWTSEAGRACDAHRLLLYRAALRLARKGHHALDLGTLDTVTTPGLARFKLGAGAVPVPLGDTRIRAPGSALVAWLAGDGPRRTDDAGTLATPPGSIA